MTNRPKFKERADVAKAVAAATGGKGLQGEEITKGGVVIPKPQQVDATGDLIFKVADALCLQVIVGRQVLLSRNNATGEGMAAGVPHFGQMLAKAREEWQEPTPLQAAKLALIEAVADFQRAVYERAPAVMAAGKAEAEAAAKAAPAPPPAAEDVLPEAPSESEARAPLSVEWGEGTRQMQAKDGSVVDLPVAP